MKFFDVAFILIWAAEAIAHGGIYTYNISGTLFQG
jgi:cellulase